MASPFVRVELSNSSRDFEPMTLGMGLPLLDERNARYQMLRKWLGTQVAEPERTAHQVGFYLRSPAGVRLERVECYPVTEDDLQRALKKEFEGLQANIARAKANTSDEEKVLRVARDEIESFRNEANKRLRCCYLFKYRDHNREWRLVWCPGYHRKDANPAGPLICTNPNCLHLFVRRDGSQKCPVCQGRIAAAMAETAPESRGGRRWTVLAFLLLLGMGAVGVWYFKHPFNPVSPDVSGSGTSVRQFDVQPRNLKLAVGEIADLSIQSPSSDLPVRLVSSMPERVLVTGSDRLIGRAEGICQVDVIRGQDIISVQVEVKVVPFRQLGFSPEQISAGLDEFVSFRVLGKTRDRENVEIAPDALDWIELPRAEFADLDKSQLRFRGLRPTGGNPEGFAVRFAGREAHGWLEVLSTSLKSLELVADGATELPAGQKLTLKVRATFKNGRTEDLPAERVEFQSEPVDGLLFNDGIVEAVTAGAGPIKITARLGGTTSNELAITSVAAVPLKITLAAEPATLAVGQRGSATLSAASPGGPVSLSSVGSAFESSDPEILAVDPESGDFQALKTGTSTIKGSHPIAGEATSAKITVVDIDDANATKPRAVHLLVDQPQPIRLSVGSEFSAFRIEAEDSDGKTRDVAVDATLRVEGDQSASAVTVEEGRITAVRAGAAVVRADYEGVESEESLAFEVTIDVDIDEIRITPTTVTVAVGESPKLTAVGYKNGNNAGTITDLKDVVWRVKADDVDEVLPGEGPVFLREAARPGTAEITAELGKIVSKPANVTIVDSLDQIPDKLTVTPGLLRLGVGESRLLGTRINLVRGSQNVTDDVQVSSAAEDVVNFDVDRRALVGVAPGVTHVTFSHGGQLTNLDIEVTRAQAPTSGTVLLLEPAGGTLRVGERLALRGSEASPAPQRRTTDRTTSLILASSDPAIISVEGSTLVGMKPGKATIKAQLPGVEAPVSAEFTVVAPDFTSLLVEPARLKLGVGQLRKYSVYGIGPQGRTQLGDHPDLKIRIEGPKPDSIESDPAKNHIRGVEPGEAIMVIGWRNFPERQIPIVVEDRPIAAIRIVPPDATIGVGETTDLQVFGRRGTEWEPLTAEDGVTLRVGKPEVAEVAGTFHVKGLHIGRTPVVALLNDHRGSCSLRVTCERCAAGVVATGSGLPGSGSTGNVRGFSRGTSRGVSGAPGVKPVGLRFVSDISRLQMGSPGDDVRVVQIFADGSEEDATQIAELSIRDPRDVVKLEKTAEGWLIRPEKLGQTRLDATSGALRTQRPMLVDVVESPTQDAVLRVRPNPLRLEVGNSRMLERAEVFPGSGQPFEVPFKVSVKNSPVIEVGDDNMIRGLKAGSAIAKVMVVDPSSKYDGLQCRLRVEVGQYVVDRGRGVSGHGVGIGSIDERWGGPPRVDIDDATGGAVWTKSNAPSLVLDGPSETTVGAEIQLNVDLIGQPGTGRDVTNEARLSLADGQSPGELAELRSGCRLVAKKPGTIELKATHGGLVSDVHLVHILAPAADFSRLELVLDSSPMVVGEKRQYTVWGYPRGGGPRQDVTADVTDTATDGARHRVRVTVASRDGNVKVVEHRPPELIGSASGTVEIAASADGKLKTRPVLIRVTANPEDESGQVFTIEPKEVVIREGQELPSKFRVLVRTRGAGRPREIDNANIESLDAGVLAPLPDARGQFRGVRPGTTRVRASLGNWSAAAEVRVIPDRFKSISEPLINQVGGQGFKFDLTITSNRTNDRTEKLEYRIVANLNDDTAWTPATSSGDQTTVKLTSPLLPFVKDKQFYQVFVQFRDTNHRDRDPEPYPYTVRLKAVPK